MPKYLSQVENDLVLGASRWPVFTRPSLAAFHLTPEELREKFRVFSGDAEMVIETRVSQDRLDDIQANLQLYAGAVTQVLDDNRGDWKDGVFYAGGYEISFGGVKHGGRNFLQLAKVSFVLQISTD